jgi:SH3-like domain-containing protein
MRSVRAFWAIAGVIVAIAPGTLAASGAELTPTGSATGLPVPRFVSLKSDRVTVRAGPTKDQDVRWVFTRAALPVEVTAEFENWRRIRDREGAEGWVYHSLLSGRRTALVEARTKAPDELMALHNGAATGSAVIARLQPGVQGSVRRCTGSWCRIIGTGFDGWIEQDRLWGVYPEEKID